MYSLLHSFPRRPLVEFRGLPRSASLLTLAVLGLLLPSTCPATTITFTESGVSALGTPLLVSAKLETAADAGGPNNLLRITLTSSGAPTVGKDDVLTSFYFNIVDPNTGIRPTLTYVSGSGQAYEVRTTGTDPAVSWSPNLMSGTGMWTTSGAAAGNPSNLVAVADANEGWQFKTLSPPPAFPGLGFGIGTVGNSTIGDFIPGATEGFTPQVVSGTLADSMINLGISSTGTGTDIVPNGGLDGKRLVRSQAVFTFTSDKDLDSLTQTWVQGNVTFGFGTSPSTVLFPEPSGVAAAAVGGLLASVWQIRRKARIRSGGS